MVDGCARFEIVKNPDYGGCARFRTFFWAFQMISEKSVWDKKSRMKKKFCQIYFPKTGVKNLLYHWKGMQTTITFFKKSVIPP